MSTVMKVLLGVVLGMLVLIGGCVALIGGAANEVSEDIDEQQADALDDATVTGCGEPDQFGLIEATGTITNDSSERSTYIVTVEFFDEAGTRIGEATSIDNAVAAGGNAEFRATGSLGEGAQVADCGIADVTRYSAE